MSMKVIVAIFSIAWSLFVQAPLAIILMYNVLKYSGVPNFVWWIWGMSVLCGVIGTILAGVLSSLPD